MTVIAWDGKTLASDKRCINNGLIRTVTKIRRIGKLLVGCAGQFDVCQEVMAWIERGANPEDFPSIQRNSDKSAGVLVIDGDKVLKYECTPYPFVIEDKHVAIGSGRDYAMAAMFLGKTAAESVAIASLFDNGCGNGVDVLERK